MTKLFSNFFFLPFSYSIPSALKSLISKLLWYLCLLVNLLLRSKPSIEPIQNTILNKNLFSAHGIFSHLWFVCLTVLMTDSSSALGSRHLSPNFLRKRKSFPRWASEGMSPVYSLQVAGKSFVAAQTGFPGGSGGKESALPVQEPWEARILCLG